MNKAIVAGLAAGVLMVGLIFSPLLSGNLLSNATAQQMMSGATKYVTLIASEKVVQVYPDNPLHPVGIMYNAMVYNGTIPGPVIAVDQGDTLMVTLINQGKVIHSIDFHSGMGPSHAIGAGVKPHGANLQPGENITYAVNALNPGAFFYHCGADGLNGIWDHIANGMYGGIIVHAKYEKPAKEFYMVFGEIYGNNIGPLGSSVNGTASIDDNKLYNNQADLFLTNGMAFKYVP
jgi:nitrite reductase (NO-forming)